MINTILLVIIAVSEVARLLLTHKKTTKKAHFKQKLEGTMKMVWDLEFKKFKTREIREDIRQQYDSLKSRIETYKQQIENWPKSKDQAERKRLEDNRVLAERDTKRFEEQMASLDAQVTGLKPTNDNPEGMIGMTEQVDSLMELCAMLKDHIKSL